jgi:hypothetical protein
LKLHRFILTPLLLLALASCDREGDPGGGAPAPGTSGSIGSPRRPTTQPGTATVRGKVTLTGWTAPKRQPQHVACGQHQHAVPDESVVASAGGGLKNVVIHVKNAPSVPVTSAEPAVLDQVKCQYVPHVLAMQIGQTLRVRNSDPTLHNVQLIGDRNPRINRGFTSVGQIDLTVKHPEVLQARCDVHPWMTAYVAVFDHPYFVVTADDGSFEIPRLPAGAYTLTAWHERFGEIEQEVTVSTGAAAQVHLNYKPPA